MKNLNLKTGALLLFSALVMVAALPVTSAFSEEMPMKTGSMQGGKAPDDARDPNEHSGGYEYRGMAGWEETDELTFSKVIVEQFEYRRNDGNNTLRWDIQGWRGKDYNKFWFKFEGEDEVSTNSGDLELQALYSRSVSAFWDFQIGGRYDREYGGDTTKDRFFAVAGFQGLAPYWFEAEPSLYVSEDGDISARLVSTYDLLFSQRLILQPRLEANISANEVREFNIGRGLNDLQLGLRLRYEVTRKFTPYIGVEWDKKFGDTSDLVRAEGGDDENTALIAGVRFWF